MTINCGAKHMSETEQAADFYGVLGRVEAHANTVSLRFYPFTFENDPAADVVYQIDFQKPDFDPRSIDGFVGQEAEIEHREDRVIITDVFGSDEISLTAKSISAYRTKYVIEDFVDHVTGLGNALDREYKGHSGARRKLKEIEALSVELRRRAKIKADASDEQARLQKSTISVLDRILAALRKD